MEVDTEQESSGQADRRKPRGGSKRLLERGLASKIADIVHSTGKSYKADATTIAISVNDRSERDITKHFKEVQIDWPVVERQLQSWSHLLRIGKTLRVNVSFNYMESGKAARTAGRGATATQLAERDVRLDAEQVASGAPDAWRQVYTVFRCLVSTGVAKAVHEVKTEVCCLNLLNCWPETALPVAKYLIASLCLTDRWFQTATPQNWPKQGSLCLLNLPERQLFVVPALAKPQNLTPRTPV